MQKEILQTWFFKQSTSEVWDYLTKPELIEQWLMKCDFKPVVGHKFRFTHAPSDKNNYDGILDCEVLEVKPFTKLSYSWKGNTKDGSRTFDSTVIWTLAPKGNGTELRLQHDGFVLVEDIVNHTNGWAFCVNRMIELINFSSNAGTNA